MRVLLALLFMSFVFLSAGCVFPGLDDSEKNETRREKTKKEVAPVFKNASLYNRLGVEACSKQQYAKSIRYFNMAIQADNTNPVSYNNMGRAYYWIGEYDQAGKYFQQALRLDPDDPRVWANLGDVFRQKGDYENAVRYYHDALENGTPSLPIQARVNYELGNLYLKQKKFEYAESRLNKAIDIQPDFDKAILARMILYHLTRRDSRAWNDLQKLEKRGYEVRAGLKKGIIKGVEASRNRQRFRPGH